MSAFALSQIQLCLVSAHIWGITLNPRLRSGNRRSTSDEYIGTVATIANEVSIDKSLAAVGGINSSAISIQEEDFGALARSLHTLFIVIAFMGFIFAITKILNKIKVLPTGTFEEEFTHQFVWWRTEKGEEGVSTEQQFTFFFFPTPTATCFAAPPAAEILKGLPLNCQSVLFSDKRSFCHLHSFYCLARQLTAQPRSSLLFPEPYASTQTAGEQPQQRKVTLHCHWRLLFISKINHHDHCDHPKHRTLALWHWREDLHRVEPGTNIQIYEAST